MKTYKKKTVKAVDKILCDACGKDCTITEPVDEHEYAELTAVWGYFSQQDGIQYDIHLCENCFNEVLGFIKEKRRKVLGPFNYPYDKDPLEGKSYFPL
jgi:hypothetical protein